jgi:(R,R)-butanediol dehydrogenase / meso-butanediol dehydrogenase / diacetyl reductase
MKALRWYGRRDLRYEDAPEPTPGHGQAKIKICLAGICGSELKEYRDGPHKIATEKLPLIAGHEFMGRVVELGPDAGVLKTGDRVAGIGSRVCGNCAFCKKGLYNLCLNSSFSGADVDGCMAEFMVTQVSSLYKLPDSVPDEAGALLEPLAVVIHAVHQSQLQPGDSVAVVGDGAIGLCALLAARAAGASRVYVVAKHPARGKIAKILGATAVFLINDGDTAASIKRITGGLGVDIALECVGSSDALNLSCDLVRRGGAVVLVGVFGEKIPFSFSQIVFDEKKIIGSSIYINEGQTAIDWMVDKRLSPNHIVTSIIPLRDAVKSGFERLLEDKESNIKILLRIS